MMAGTDTYCKVVVFAVLICFAKVCFLSVRWQKVHHQRPIAMQKHSQNYYQAEKKAG